MKRIYASLILLSLGCIAAQAQKFNPRIEVTNAYEGKVVDARKTDLSVNIPDSLTNFSYKIDYSVFDNPYKGSYEFRPYQIEMKPTERRSQRNSLFVNAGVGYTFHPEAQVVWSPVMKKNNFGFSIYDSFNGYMGPYNRQFYTLDDTSYLTTVDRNGEKYSGWLLDNDFGINTAWYSDKVKFTADLGWDFINSADTLTSRIFNNVRLKTRLSSAAPSRHGYYFNGALNVNAAMDDLTFGKRGTDVREIGGDVAFTLGKSLSKKNAVEADLGFQIAAYAGMLESYAVKISVTPKYIFEGNRFLAHLGAKFSYVTSADDAFLVTSLYENNITKPFFVAPEVRLRFSIIPQKLFIYADATGGVDINTYSSLVARNPYSNAYFTKAYNAVCDNSNEKYNVIAGFKGNIATCLQWDICAGIASHGNALLDALALVIDDDGAELYPYWTYADYNEKFAQVSLDWKSDHVDAAAKARYSITDLAERQTRAIYPSQMTGDIAVTYNYQHRLFVGVNCSAASSRKGLLYLPGYSVDFDAITPGWVDLGASARFKFNNIFTFWLKAGNLLGQNVQRYFMHSEKGIWVTAGVTLNIQ